MPRKRSREPLTHGRSRSQTPSGRRTRTSTLSEPPEMKPAHRSRQVTQYQGSILEGTTATALKDLQDRLAETEIQNAWLEGKYRSLREQNEKLAADYDKLQDENKSLRCDVDSLSRSLELKSVECLNLKADITVSADRPVLNRHGSGSSLSLVGNLFSWSKTSQRPDEQLITDLHADLVQRQSLNRRLQEANAKLREKVAQQERHIQAQTAEFAQELAKIRHNALPELPTVSDTEIQQNWKALKFAVRQFVSTHLPESLDPTTLDCAMRLKSFNWLPVTPQALRAPVLCPIMLESWIWHFLYGQVFNPYAAAWAGDAGRRFNSLCETLQGRDVNPNDTTSDVEVLRTIHEWRAHAAYFIMSMNERNYDSRLATVAVNMLDQLRVIISSATPDGQLSQAVHTEALDIVRKATELDKIFRQSKAVFHVFITRLKEPLIKPPHLDFKFDPETMEQLNSVLPGSLPGTDPVANLAVSPGILKVGNADGTNHHAERVLVKLQALCNLKATLEFLGGGEMEEVSGTKQQPKIKQEGGDSVVKQEDDDCDVDMLPCHS